MMRSNKEYQELMIAVLEMKKKNFIEEIAEENDYTNGIIAGIEEAIYTLKKSDFLIEE